VAARRKSRKTAQEQSEDSMKSSGAVTRSPSSAVQGQLLGMNTEVWRYLPSVHIESLINHYLERGTAAGL